MLGHWFLNKYVVGIVMKECSFDDSHLDSQSARFVQTSKINEKKKIPRFTKICALFFKNLCSGESSLGRFLDHLWQGRHRLPVSNGAPLPAYKERL